VLSWPSNAAGFNLQSCLALADPAWQPIAATPELVGGLIRVALPTTNAAQYFRLAR
jgi:hypothetical protein